MIPRKIELGISRGARKFDTDLALSTAIGRASAYFGLLVASMSDQRIFLEDWTAGTEGHSGATFHPEKVFPEWAYSKYIDGWHSEHHELQDVFLRSTQVIGTITVDLDKKYVRLLLKFFGPKKEELHQKDFSFGTRK